MYTLNTTEFTSQEICTRYMHSAQEWTNRTVAKHACSKMGRAAARRNTPKQPRAIRAGPHDRGNKIWGPNTGGLSNLVPNTGSLSGFVHTVGLSDLLIPGVLSDFLSNTGVYLIFHYNSGGLSKDF